MPQMAPMNWLFLYFIFIMTFILFVIMNYYIFLYPPKTIKPFPIKKTVTWKW